MLLLCHEQRLGGSGYYLGLNAWFMRHGFMYRLDPLKGLHPGHGHRSSKVSLAPAAEGRLCSHKRRGVGQFR